MSSRFKFENESLICSIGNNKYYVPTTSNKIRIEKIMKEDDTYEYSVCIDMEPVRDGIETFNNLTKAEVIEIISYFCFCLFDERYKL